MTGGMSARSTTNYVLPAAPTVLNFYTGRQWAALCRTVKPSQAPDWL